MIALEDEFVFEIPPSESEKFFAVPDIVDYISKHPMAKGLMLCCFMKYLPQVATKSLALHFNVWR